MLDSMYQDGTDQVLDDRVARPLQAPTVRPSFGANVWNTTKAPFAGIGAGANESAGMFSDILGAYGAVQAGIGLQADPTLLFDSDAQNKRIKDGQKSRDEIQSGEAFSTDLGTGFRVKARSFMPDPATSNIAEDILFGVGRFATKAVGYTVAGGPVAGPVLTAVDEGMTEADKLKTQGVDFTTRTKVGAVAGVAAGAAVALPVAGKTLAQTAALVAAGGPASFIAQQAASKAILENAGYDQIADQYDPFDPVGLIVSTLVPAAFGAHAMLGKGKAKPPAINPEAVDAARVNQVQQQIVESNPYHPADVAGANDHVAAVERAHDQMAAGEPVNVTDIVSAERIDAERAQEFVNRVQNAIDESAPIPDFVTNPAKTSMDKANRMMSDLMADPDIPAPVKTRLQQASLNSLMKPENKAYVAAVSNARKTGNLDPANIDRIHQQMVKPTPDATKAPAAAPDQATAAPKATGEGKAAPSPFEAQTAELVRTSPDMMVQLEGMDKPVRLADALEAVKKEAANDVQDANLLQVAADCFLRSA